MKEIDKEAIEKPISSFRTSSIFHYTKKIEDIQGILEHGLIPNYCKEDLTYKDENNKDIGLYLGLPMVSFCDIPISKTNEHIRRYGAFGIGLKKKSILKKNINPIMYAYNDQILKAIYPAANVMQQAINELKQIKDIYFKQLAEIQSLKNDNKQVAEIPSLKNDNNLLQNITQFAQKCQNLENLEKEKEKNDRHLADVKSTIETGLILIGFVKKYAEVYNDTQIVCYEENEWRYVVKHTTVHWLFEKETYDKWRTDSEQKPPPTPVLKDNTLKFKVENISWIIVENDEEIINMTHFIDSLQTLGGNPIENELETKALLCSKIISLETIGSDM